MGTSNYDESKAIDKADKSKQQIIKDVYVAVFFDGTGNNMVQKMYFNDRIINTPKSKKEKPTSSKGVEEEYDEISRESKDKEEWGLIERKKEAQNRQAFAAQMIASNYGFSNYYIDEYEEATKVIQECDDKLEQLNVETKIGIDDISKAMYKVSNPKDEKEEKLTNEGYSNVAILYSLFNKKFPMSGDDNKENGSYIVKSLYIEGAGATDISESLKSNTNGLGFGLGLTGVTALVSKAVRYVTNYVNSIIKDQDTKFHFYVFGFSRGSTCARLFSYLLTRDKNEKLNKREHEFKDFLPTYFDEASGRLKFLEDYREKITVEFLGIYDTVASIGLLKQKDGWSDPLGVTYKEMPNYKNNWHFLNVQEYGLGICKDKNKLKEVCHICALDEFRENFALTNIGKEVPSNAIEILIPGCHSDVGGGYVNRSEEPATILHKECKRNGKKIKTLVNFTFPHENATKKQYITTTESVAPKDCMPMSLDAFEELGWIKKNTIGKINDQKYEACTLSAIENEGFFFNHIKFKRCVLRGYSDIPLAMMHKRCCDKVGAQFFEEIIDEFSYKKHERLLSEIGEEMIKLVDENNNQRIWYYPDNSYTSDYYKKLRFNYLHFTSTGRIAHFNRPFSKDSDFVEFEGANFGNKPNFSVDGLLCRITYHGDDSNNEVNSWDKHVHYLYEIGQCGPSKIYKSKLSKKE